MDLTFSCLMAMFAMQGVYAVDEAKGDLYIIL